MALKRKTKVLITFGVIGIIGTLVLPTLMGNMTAAVSAKKPGPPPSTRPVPPPPPPPPLPNGAAFCIGTRCFSAPVKATPITRSECNSLKSKLGIKSCEYYNDDYWAGAVKQCGHVNNMITMQELATMATNIYGKQVGTINNVTCPTVNGKQSWCRQSSKLPTYGFSTIKDNDIFVVYAQEEISGSYARIREFSPNKTESKILSRRQGGYNYFAVCAVSQ